MIFIVIMKSGGDYYLLSDGDGVISSAKTAEVWTSHFEDMYNRSHDRSYEGSMSACINWLSFQPSVISIENTEDIGNRLLDLPFKVQSVRNVAGGFTGCTSDRDMSEEWENGIKPRLITLVGEDGYKTREQLIER